MPAAVVFSLQSDSSRWSSDAMQSVPADCSAVYSAGLSTLWAVRTLPYGLWPVGDDGALRTLQSLSDSMWTLWATLQPLWSMWPLWAVHAMPQSMWTTYNMHALPSNAGPGEYAFMVTIKTRPRCGGALVTLSSVLTIASCVTYIVNQTVVKEKNDLNKTLVSAGIIGMEGMKSVDYQERKIKKATPHGNFKKILYRAATENNVAIAHLEAPFILTLKVLPMPIYSYKPPDFKTQWKKMNTKAKGDCKALGWGTTMYRKKIPNRFKHMLNTVEVTVEGNMTRCAEAISKGSSANKSEMESVCVKPAVTGDGFCQGSGGNFLFCDDYVWALGGARCEDRESPFIYTLLGNYLNHFDIKSKSPYTTPSFNIFLIVLTAIFIQNKNC